MEAKKTKSSSKKKKLKKKAKVAKAKSTFLWLPYALLSFLVVLVYHPSVNHDFAVDDKIVIEENKNVQRGIVAIPSIFANTTFYGFDFGIKDKTYRPMVLSMYAMEISAFGLNPGIHHLFNLFYFLLLGFGIYYLCSKYFFPQKHWALSAGIAAIFLAHPLHVEAVANIKGRDDVACFLFFITALILLFRYFETKHQKLLWLSGLVYLAALFSKEMAVTFLPVFPMAIYFFTKRSVNEVLLPWQRWLPYVSAVIIFFLFRAVAIHGSGFEITAANNGLLVFEQPLQRWAMKFYVLLLYLKLHFWPNPLLWDYSLGHFEYDQMKLILGIASLIIYGGLFAFAIKTFRQKNVWSFGILFYLATLSLVSNIFVTIASTMGERLIFIPSFGLLLILCYGLYQLMEKFQPNNKVAFYSYGIIALLLPAAYFANDRVKDWKDGATLVMHDAQYGNSFRLRKAYVQEMADRKTGDAAVNQQAALEVVKQLVIDKPDDHETWYYYGNILKSRKQYQEATVAFQNSINLKGNSFASHNLGDAYFQLGRRQDAITYFKQALELKPDQALSAKMLAHTYHLEGDYANAKSYYELTLRLTPNDQEVQRNYQTLLNGG